MEAVKQDSINALTTISCLTDALMIRDGNLSRLCNCAYWKAITRHTSGEGCEQVSPATRLWRRIRNRQAQHTCELRIVPATFGALPEEITDCWLSI